MTVKRNNLLVSTAMLIGSFIIVMITSKEMSYIFMAVLSILQLLFNIFVVKKCQQAKLISFFTMFLVFSWFFHCGQIVKIAFNIPGNVPLDVTSYVDMSVINVTFRFYFLSQCMVVIGMLLYHKNKHSQASVVSRFNSKMSSVTLIILGILPRLYIDLQILVGGLEGGYSGVYSLVFPQALQTIAFFFDAGCIIALMDNTTSSKKDKLFWIILVYKCITMLTGARQERTAFLIVWLFVYFYVVNQNSIKNTVILLFFGLIGIMFVNSIGSTRGEGLISISQIFGNAFSRDGNVFGNMMGEFGSALTTLAVTIKQVPATCSWGMGDAYLAGLLSIVPTLANRLGVGDAAAYVTKLSGVDYFGGSYLGEAYYNFSWFGIILCVVVGLIVAKLNNDIYDKDKYGRVTKKSIFAVIIMMTMILLVRGYFTDMVQKIVWTAAVLYFVNDRKIVFRRKQ